MFKMPGSQVVSYQGQEPVFGQNCFLASGAVAVGDLITGDDVGFWFNSVVRADCHYIRIGSRVNIQDGTVVHVTNKRFPTVIEDEVSVGHNAVVHGCTIRRGTLVGMGAQIMDGVEVGEYCLVAAGALLSPGKTFPERSLIKGTPAKVVRRLTDEELSLVTNTHLYYLEYKKNYIETR